jgi:hypothetical protein
MENIVIESCLFRRSIAYDLNKLNYTFQYVIIFLIRYEYSVHIFLLFCFI